jgi:hypothetical protein
MENETETILWSKQVIILVIPVITYQFETSVLT